MSGTARMGVHSLPACSNSRIKGSPSIMIIHVLGGTPLLILVRSVGLHFGGRNEVVEEEYFVPGKAHC